MNGSQDPDNPPIYHPVEVGDIAARTWSGF
jgi:hypothetical protein